jgi:tetratricopeptide (TPR) repeat protein
LIFRTTLLALVAIALFLPAVQADDNLLALGEFHLRHRDPKTAIGYFEKAVEKDAGNVHAHLGLQEAATRSGADVLDRYLELVTQFPKDATANFLLGKLLTPEKALERLNAVPKPNFYVRLGRARAMSLLGQKTAASEIAAAEGLVPEDARAIGLIAGYYEDEGDLRKAADYFSDVLSLVPDRIEALVGLGDVRRRLGDFEGALDVLNKANGLDKEDPEIAYRLGLVQLDQFKPDEAIENFMRCRQLTPPDYKDVDVLLALGDAYLYKDEPARAEEHLRKAVEFAPRRTAAWRRLGHALEIQDENDEALAAFQEIAKIDPLNAACHTAIGWIFIKKGKFDDAMKEFRQAGDMDREDVTPLFLIGYTYDVMGRWSEAIDAYEKALRVDDEYARAYNNIGLDHDLLGKTSKALKALKKAVDLDPENPEYALNLGNAYYNAGKFKEGAKIFSDIVDYATDIVDAWTGLGRCYRALRKYKESAEAYEAAIEIDPEDPDLHLIVGIIHQENLKNYQAALDHYKEYIRLGGEDPLVQGWIDEVAKKIK